MLGGPRHGPRPLDVDLLLLGDVELETERLTLPHREVTTPAVRARAAARARPRAGAARRRPRLADALAALAEREQRSSGSGSLPGAAAVAAQRLEPGRRQDRRRVAREVGDDAHRQLARRAGPRSPARRSSRVIARRRLARSGGRRRSSCSPPSTPSAIQSSIRCSIPGRAARSARTFSSVGLVEPRRAATIGAGRSSRRARSGTPSRAPSE